MDTKKIGERILMRRNQLEMTLDDVATDIGVARSTIQRYEKGTITKVKLPVIEAIARTLRVNPEWLCCKSDDMVTLSLPPSATSINFSNFHKIPILGNVSAGLPMYAEENIEGYTVTDLNGAHEYFALRVRGDSMNAIGINDGYLIIVRVQDEVENGDVAVVLVNNEEATVKRFYSTNTTVTLMPQSTNSQHQPQIYDVRETEIRILGKVVKVEFTL